MTTSDWDEDAGEVFARGDGEPEILSASDSRIGNIPVPDEGSTLSMMVRAARDLQRDPKKLIDRAKQIGGLLGKKGFYRFPAGGKNIQGESIHLAQALAQEWGGIVYQTRIVSADTLGGGGMRVHLRSSVADMAALVCAEVDQMIATAPPPGKFAKDHEQRERWNGMQIQNASSKVVRNAILDVLPKWFTQPAFNAAMAMADTAALGKYPKGHTKEGQPKSLADAREDAVSALAERGCKREELELYLDQPFDMWAAPQIGTLRDLYADLKSSTISIEAWRAALAEKQTSKPNGNGGGASKSALGLPAKTGQTVDDAMKGSVEPQRETVPAGEQQSLGTETKPKAR